MARRNSNSAGERKLFADDAPIPLTLRELRAIASSGRFWVSFFALVLVLAIAGPFDTGDLLGFPARFFYWMLLALLTVFVAIGTSMALGIALGDAGMPHWPARLVGGFVAGLPVTLIVWTVSVFGFGFGLASWPAFFELLIYCTVISEAGTIIDALFMNRDSRAPSSDGTASSQGQPPAESPKRPTLLGRLTRPLGADIISLNAQDHYVEIRTSLGSELLLIRLADAIAELDGAKGMQVHRSWWVATEHVVSAIREGDRLVLQMSDGTRVPVSRTHRASVRRMAEEAGIPSASA